MLGTRRQCQGADTDTIDNRGRSSRWICSEVDHHRAIGAPAWPELLAEARAALTSLMTQLILDHAATTATPRAKEVGQ